LKKGRKISGTIKKERKMPPVLAETINPISEGEVDRRPGGAQEKGGVLHAVT